MPGIPVTRSSDSVFALRKYLGEVAASPTADEKYAFLIPYLHTQKCLAKLAMPERNIRGTSLNTLKRIADRYLEGGYVGIEDLRKRCIKRLTSKMEKKDSEKVQKSTRRSLHTKVKDLQNSHSRLVDDFMFLSERLGVSMMQARVYAAAAGPEMEALCRREQREILDSLGLRTSIGDLNGPRTNKP